MSSPKKNLTLLAATFLFGIAAGRFSIDFTQIAHAGNLEQNLPALQAAHSALEMIQYDMQRAGYNRIVPRSEVTVRVVHEAKLKLVNAGSELLTFESPDGKETITYHNQYG